MLMLITSDKAERLIAEAASYGAQLVVFPEAFVGGYPRGSTFGVTIGNRTAKGREEFRRYHASAIDVPGKIRDFFVHHLIPLLTMFEIHSLCVLTGFNIFVLMFPLFFWKQ